MNEFLDLLGASGRRYRYSAAVGELSPAGGNFAVIRLRSDDSWDMVRLAQTDSLAAEAIYARDEALAHHGDAIRLFVRLNISRRVRDEELADLLAAYSPLPKTRVPA